MGTMKNMRERRVVSVKQRRDFGRNTIISNPNPNAGPTCMDGEKKENNVDHMIIQTRSHSSRLASTVG